MEKKYYGAIDGLRMIAAFGIVMMHIGANNSYEISGFIYNIIIPSFTDFVFLFMIVSAFGMCCGYHEKLINNKLPLSDFYEKRFKKIFPFFSVLVLFDIMVSPSPASIYEGFADLTLLFGFLPEAGNISVIGVGWFLGLIFVFYLIFPFFCVLLENKRKAWKVFIITLIYNFTCTNYFQVSRSNILYSACFFLAGGLIYLYRDEVAKLNQWLVLGLIGVSAVLYYTSGRNVYMCLLVSSFLLSYGIIKQGGLLENRVTKFFSNISMEIYLSHMAIFRVVEKIGINKWFGNGWVGYAITVIIVFCGVTVFAVVMKKVIENVVRKIEQKEMKETVG